ncbi:MAG: DUF3617 domain-containing protein [Elusimicrobia bacterium]|nr:DUF3617 domain-containing protein [Elusimicrobiota bacterium]
MRTLSLLLAATALALPAARLHAAEKGELWEITTKMDMAGMPDMSQMPPGMAEKMAGRMGGGTQQVCREAGDHSAEMSKKREMKDCTVSKPKESGSTVTMTFDCKGGRSGKFEMTYASGRASYTGVATMKDPSHGEMKMNMTGKKIGACDVAKYKQERDEKVAALKKQGDDAMAAGKKSVKDSNDKQIAECGKAVETMKPEGLGLYGRCGRNPDQPMCKSLESMEKLQPEVSKTCKAKADLWCKRFQTQDGFLAATQAHSVKEGEELCRVQAADIKANLCPKALKKEAWEFVGSVCPKEAKPIAKAHCAGRSYTAKKVDKSGDKWDPFCRAYAGLGMSDDADAAAEGSAPAPKEKAAKSVKEAVADQAVDAGLNKLKGLFGR